MKLSDLGIVALVLVAILIATFTIQGDFGRQYDVQTTGESKVAEITAFDEMNEISSNMQDKILKISSKASKLDLTAIYDVGSLFLDIGAYLLKIPNVLNQALEITLSLLNITVPGWFKILIITTIGFLAVLAAASIFLKRVGDI